MALALALFCAAPAAAQRMPDPPPEPAPTIIYLVRHAETAPDGTRNPPLSEEGEARARWLAVILSHAQLDAVYSTDYHRTLETATGAARANHLQTTLYDPGDLYGLARRLRDRPGRFLVVGHSNTTPALAAALGADGGRPIEEWEFDRLYTILIRSDTVQTVMLRY